MNVTDVVAGQPPLHAGRAPRVPAELLRKAARRRRQTRPLGSTMRRARRSEPIKD